MNIKQLADLHEDHVAQLLGGRKTKGSGNQWNDPADGRHPHHTEFAFAWDCKAAMPGTNSIGVTRLMVAKIREQASPERLAIPLRFYRDARGGVEYDLIAVTIDDFAEMLDFIRRHGG